VKSEAAAVAGNITCGKRFYKQKAGREVLLQFIEGDDPPRLCRDVKTPGAKSNGATVVDQNETTGNWSVTSDIFARKAKAFPTA